jgi:hypothetical protein
MFTAVVAERAPTADGKGQIVVFFRGKTFASLALPGEVAALAGVKAAGPGEFVVGFVNYRSSDPLCCPSGTPRSIERTYRWDGRAFAPDSPVPANLTAYGGERVVVSE